MAVGMGVPLGTNLLVLLTVNTPTTCHSSNLGEATEAAMVVDMARGGTSRHTNPK